MDLTRVTVFCFAASYLAALGIEAAALAPWRGALVVAGRRWALLLATGAGLAAHLAYLAVRASREATPLSSPADWCLLAAAAVALAYLVVSLSHARWGAGLVLLPVVLGLVALSCAASELPMAPERASVFWGQAHGWLLVAATASVAVGFVAGGTYLLQSGRLRRKLPPLPGIGLPSLELLERTSGRSLSISVWLTAGGFLSGLLLARLRGGGGAALGGDPVVLTSAALFAWLAGAEAFRWAFRSTARGKRVAYATIAAFGFLAIAVVSLAAVGAGHGGISRPAAATPGPS